MNYDSISLLLRAYLLYHECPISVNICKVKFQFRLTASFNSYNPISRASLKTRSVLPFVHSAKKDPHPRNLEQGSIVILLEYLLLFDLG